MDRPGSPLAQVGCRETRGDSGGASVSVKDFHKSQLRSAKVYPPDSLLAKKRFFFWHRGKLSVLIKVPDTNLQAEAPVHTGRLPDYTFLPF